MRVALDGTPLIGPRTGVGWYTYELVDAMAAASPDDSFTLLPISWRTARVMEVPHWPNVSVLRRFAPALPLWWAWKNFRRPSLERFVDCDVFHATNYMAPPSRRTPIVTTVHDLSFVRFPETCLPAVLEMGRLLPAVLRQAAAIITVSAFTRDELVDWMPEVAGKVVVVHEGFRPRRTAASDTGIGPGPPYVLFIGTLSVRKNLDVLLQAVATLKREGMALRAVLAGQLDSLLDVPALLRAHDLSDGDVVLTGYVTEERAAALLRDAAAFAFPSRYEGFGLPILEAMAAGVPVVAAKAGALPEVAGDAALLVVPDDAYGFATALRQVLQDDGLRAELVRRGHIQSAAFTWRQAATATMDIYREVVG